MTILSPRRSAGGPHRRHEVVSGGVSTQDANRVVGGSQGELPADLPATPGSVPEEVFGFDAERAIEPPREIHVDRLCAPGIERVFLRDDRRPVRETGAVPWRQICWLEMEFPGGRRMYGSGALIGPRAVATAGHCVKYPGLGWAERIHVAPGALSAVSLPYGRFTSERDYTTTQHWSEKHLPGYDYAVIRLPERVGDTLGYMSFASLASGELEACCVNCAGYPTDKEPGTLWWDSNVVARLSRTRLYYKIDTHAGQSGAPVWKYDPDAGRRVIVGVHTADVDTANAAVRVNRYVVENLRNWGELGGVA